MQPPSRIILSKLGFAAHKQPKPPIGDDPAAVEQLVHDVLKAVGALERKLYALEEHSIGTAPVSAEHVQQLGIDVARYTLEWLRSWPAAERLPMADEE